MATSQADVVKIIKSGTELGLNKWVGRRIKFSSDAVGLETIDTSSHVINIITPSGNNWVSIDGGAWNLGAGQALLESYTNKPNT